jgi:hypothetical protein
MPDDASRTLVYSFFFLHGIGASLFISAFWPCIKLIVFRDLTTTAYGIAYSVMNAMEFAGCALIGVIIDHTVHASGGYLWSSIFLFTSSILTALSGFAILVWDYKDKRTLYHGIVNAITG